MGYTLYTLNCKQRYARNLGTLKTAWWQFLSLLGVTGFDKVSLRWAASRGLLAT